MSYGVGIIIIIIIIIMIIMIICIIQRCEHVPWEHTVPWELVGDHFE